MFRFVLPSRGLARALLIPAAGLAALAGVMPASASAATAPTARAQLSRELSAMLHPTAPAATGSTVTLGSAGASVKLANGQSWLLSVADQSRAGGLSVALSHGTAASAELHLWDFASTASSLTYSKTTGDATIKGGTATGKVATVDVSFKATSHKASACVSGSETVYTGTMSGEVILTTGLSAAGTVGGKSLSFGTGGASTLTVDNNCTLQVDTCPSASIWGLATQSASLVAAGGTETIDGKNTAEAAVEHLVTLSSPKGASRVDLATVETATPSWNASSHVLSITTASSGLITGSATESGGTPSTTTTKCTWQGKTYTDKTTENFSANWSSPSGKPITAHTALTGTLKMPTSAKNAEYFITVASS